MISWEMQNAGKRVLEKAKFGDCQWDLMKNIYQAMDEVRAELPEPTAPASLKEDDEVNSYYLWPASSGAILLRRMGTSHIHKALKRLVNNLDEDENDPQDDNFKILWIGRFQQELRRRATLN